MSHIRKINDKWRADVNKNGVRKSARFETKSAAKNWASQVESDIQGMRFANYGRHTFSEAIDRYLQEVSPKKKSYAKEKLRFEFLKREFPNLVRKPLHEVTASDMALWRNNRSAEVSSATVLREMSIIGNLFTIAKKEWGWCGDSPLKSIEKPAQPPSRDRRVLPSEVKLICRQLGYVTGSIQNKQQEVALAFLISLRTAMRAGEVLSLNAERVNLKDRVLTVPHKTQHITGKERQIPITKKAARLIGVLADHGYFSVSSSTLDALFRRARDVQGIKNLHFHDARAEALTRLSRKVDVMTLAKISGHRDLSILQNTYYRETAADIAARI